MNKNVKLDVERIVKVELKKNTIVITYMTIDESKNQYEDLYKQLIEV